MRFEELSPKEQKSAITFGNTVTKPESHYNGIVDSGMFNRIIEGYILLAMDELGIELKNGQRGVISYLFDNYSAQDARNRQKK